MSQTIGRQAQLTVYDPLRRPRPNPRPAGDRGRGSRRAAPARAAVLLNARWHKGRAGARLPRCPVCDDAVPVGDHAVRHGGELYHHNCARAAEVRAETQRKALEWSR